MGVALLRREVLGDLLQQFGGQADPDVRDRVVARVCAPDDVHPDVGRQVEDLVILTSARYLRLASLCEGVVLCSGELSHRLTSRRRWVHSHALWVLARLLSFDRFADREQGEAPPRQRASPGPTAASRSTTEAASIYRAGLGMETARVSPEARLAPGVEVRAGAIIMGGVAVGAGSVIFENTVIYPGVEIGERVRIGPLAVVGRAGFGWARGPAGDMVRIPHRGGVYLGDDVEVGPFCTVDAGILSPTRLDPRVRLDAHVHVGHNVVIEADTFVAAQAGFAGSVRVGPGVLVGGQAGIADHVRIGAGARIAAQSGVIGDVPPRATVAGFPAVPKGRLLRSLARLLRSEGRGLEGRGPRSKA